MSAIVMFPLNLDSGQELHPGSVADLQGILAHCQPPLLELDPAETGGRHSMHTRGPSTWRLIQQMQQCAATHWAANTRGSPHEESAELTIVVPACRATLSRESVEIVSHCCTHTWHHPPKEKVELAKLVVPTHRAAHTQGCPVWSELGVHTRP